MKIRGSRIFYRSSGTGAPIILLHGFPTSSYDWRNFLEPLSKFGRVIAPDLYGFGYSEATQEARLSEFLPNFVSAMGIGLSTLVGYDIGGSLALDYAVQSPSTVRRLVIMNTTAYPGWVDHARKSRSYATARRLMKSSLYRGISILMLNRRQVQRILAYASHVSFPDEVLDHQVFFFRRGIRRLAAMNPRVYTEPFFKDAEESLTRLEVRIKNLGIPTIIIFGKNDSFIPQGTAERLHSDIQGSRLYMLDETGHFLVEERPDEIIQLINGFL